MSVDKSIFPPFLTFAPVYEYFKTLTFSEEDLTQSTFSEENVNSGAKRASMMHEESHWVIESFTQMKRHTTNTMQCIFDGRLKRD